MATQDRKSTVLERAITEIKSWNSEDEVPWLTHRAAIEILTAAVQEAVKEAERRGGEKVVKAIESIRSGSELGKGEYYEGFEWCRKIAVDAARNSIT